MTIKIDLLKRNELLTAAMRDLSAKFPGLVVTRGPEGQLDLKTSNGLWVAYWSYYWANNNLFFRSFIPVVDGLQMASEIAEYYNG